MPTCFAAGYFSALPGVFWAVMMLGFFNIMCLENVCSISAVKGNGVSRSGSLAIDKSATFYGRKTADEL